MQQVLSVDITVNPIQIVVANVSGRVVELVAKRSFELESHLFAALHRPVSSMGSGEESGSVEDPGRGQEIIEYVPPTQEQLSDLNDLFASLNTDTTASLLIIPAVDCFSLKLDLPFSDSRLVNKIINSEVQDATPFPAEDFVLNHQRLKTINNATHRFNISAVAKDHLARILSIFKLVGFDPTHVTTPAGVMSSVPFLAPDIFDQSCALVTSRHNVVYFTAWLDGRIYHERFLNYQQPLTSIDPNTITTELKQSIAATERLLQTRIEKVFLVNQRGSIAELRQMLGRDIVLIENSELIKEADEDSGLALMGTVLIQDESPPPLLSNFRCGEFSYGLQLKELKAGLKKLLPYLTAALMTIVLSMLVLYLFLSYQVDRTEGALRQEISRILPSFPQTNDNLRVALAEYKNELITRLGVLGSDTKYSPLDALAFISRDINISADQKIRVNRLRITGSQISLEGHASEASAIERLENSLRRKRKVYCRVKRAAISGSYNFTLEFHLCD